MKNVLKWLLLIGGGLIAIVVLILLIVPLFVDVQKYKPHIEKQVSTATGRSFSMGDDLRLTLFPWAGISFSDLHLGNPADFEEKDFASIQSFEVRMKLIPLLFKDIQVKRLVIKSPRIVLERTKDNRLSWQGIGNPTPETSAEEKSGQGEPTQGLSIKALKVDQLVIADGTILWIDHVKEERREISAVDLRLEDVSLERPIQLAFSAQLDQQPVSLKGSFGPLGQAIGKGKLPLDLDISLFKELTATLKGHIVDPASTPQFDLNLDVSAFSLRKLMAKLGQGLPVATADPEVLTRIAVKAALKGDPQKVAISGGILDLDDSKLAFSATAQDFSKPDISFDLSLDQIDLDRYLPPPPPPSEKDKPVDETPSVTEAGAKPQKVDYAPLRRLILKGAIRIEALKIKKARIQDLNLKISGNKGIFDLDPFTLNLYQGDASVKGTLNVQQDTPRTKVQMQAQKIQVEPLLKDVLEKDILSGAVNVQATLNMSGDDPQRIKQTLNGKGDLKFKDGAIKGIDLPGMLRNVKAKYGLAPQSEKRPETDFSALHVPFTMTKGVFNTPEATLSSPVLRLNAAGDADLVKETLKFRIEPKVVPTLKGQGDDQEYSGILVPVLVGGTFAKPSFQPDLKSIYKDSFKEGVPDVDALKQKFKKGTIGKDELKDSLNDKTKNLLKSLPFNK